MYILITIFYLSLIGIVVMIALKRQEEKTGEPNVLCKVGVKTDHIWEKTFSVSKNTVSYINKHTFIAIAQWFAFHILFHIRKLYVEIKHQALLNPHSRKVIDAVRGRGEIRKEGVSFYLRRISR